MTMNNIDRKKLANLSAEKRALLELKLKNRKNKNNHNLKYQAISPRENRNSVPLSFAQQRLWFLAQLEPNSPFYNISKAVRLSGDLNVQILQQALDAIVSHHEIVRTNYISENGDPIQVIKAARGVELPIIDLQQYGQAEPDRVQILQQESQRPFNLESDMMLWGCLLKLAPQEHILLLVMHHIASDGWSMGILWEQLTQLYQAELNGQSNPLETLPIQYADYAVWQREWLSDEILETKFDLLLSVTEKDGTLVGSWNYSTDLFNAATIERMTAHFQTLLEGIVDNPQQPIAQLPLLTTNERPTRTHG